ncbi:DUF2332 domain-containing protein [Arthrobacter monumenti]
MEAPGSSACYIDWTLGISEDPEVLELIDSLPGNKRQPNLVLAAARLVGAQIGPYGGFRSLLLQRWNSIRDIALARSTQTNEAGRCATLLPVLASIAEAEDKPLALIEAGASAGLCLFPDKFSYQYDGGPRLDPAGGPGAAVLECTTTGNVPVPRAVPEVGWRSGVDLNPLDVTNPDDTAWLEALVWPEQEFRRRRLRAALEVASLDPPRLIPGDVNEHIEALVHSAPEDCAVVVFHSAVLPYMPQHSREQFVETMHRLPCHWISNEGAGVLPQNEAGGVLPEVSERLADLKTEAKGRFILALDGQPLALTGPHGQSLHWLG